MNKLDYAKWSKGKRIDYWEEVKARNQKTMIPSTSLAAYKSVSHDMLASHYSRILRALERLGKANYEAISTEAGFTDKNQTSRRLKELELKELVIKTGTKSLTTSGRQAFEYTVKRELKQLNLF